MSSIEYQTTLRKVAEALPEWKFDIEELDYIGKQIDSQPVQVYPRSVEVLRCFYDLSPKDVKVVILGQDCYHTTDVADGLAFSTKKYTIPPSLRNIFKELKDDIGIENTNPNLYPWKKQGVLLLNTSLSVQKGKPNSHSAMWYEFTQSVIFNLCKRSNPPLFILWGKSAQDAFYDSVRTSYDTKVIKSAQPSPFSADRGFFGSKPFSRTNEFLLKNDIEPIDWRT